MTNAIRISNFNHEIRNFHFLKKKKKKKKHNVHIFYSSKAKLKKRKKKRKKIAFGKSRWQRDLPIFIYEHIS